MSRSGYQKQIFKYDSVLQAGHVEASAHQHPSFIALESNPVLIYRRLEKCVIREYYFTVCLGVSFLDSLDNSITCECTPEETESSENSLHPDFAKVIKLTFYYADKFELLVSYCFHGKEGNAFC